MSDIYIYIRREPPERSRRQAVTVAHNQSLEGRDCGHASNVEVRELRPPLAGALL